jgi:hypothetical protein
MAEGLVLALEGLVVVQLICVLTMRLYSVELLLQEVVVGLELILQGGMGVVVDQETVVVLPIVVRMVLLVHLVVCLVVLVVLPHLAPEDLVEMGVHQAGGAPGAVAVDTLVVAAEEAVVIKEGVVVDPVTVVVHFVSQLYMGRQRAATTESRIYILHPSLPRSPANSPAGSQHTNRGSSLQVNQQLNPVVSHLCSPQDNHLCSLPANHLCSQILSHPRSQQNYHLLSRLRSRLINLCWNLVRNPVDNRQ